ncbi:MAG: pilus assembly protein PilM [bacterium]
MLGFNLLGLGGSKDFVSLDFGSSSLKVAKVDLVDDTSINVTMSDSEDVGNPSPDEKVEQFSRSLRVLMERNNIPENTNVLMALPTNSVIVRYLELPSMPEDRMGEVIRYEAESHIPFPLEEVVLDYHIIDRDEEATELILVAIKKDKLDEHVEIVHEAGMDPDTIDVSAFSVFNLFQRMGDLEEGDNDPKVMVDIGHANTDIIIFKGDTLQFARSASVASESITEDMTKKLGVEPDEAEALKREYGHVPLGEVEEPQADDEGGGKSALDQLAEEREAEQESEEEPQPTEEDTSGVESSEEDATSGGPDIPSAPGESDESDTGSEGEDEGLSIGVPQSPDDSGDDEEKTGDSSTDMSTPDEEEEAADGDQDLNLGTPKPPSPGDSEESGEESSGQDSSGEPSETNQQESEETDQQESEEPSAPDAPPTPPPGADGEDESGGTGETSPDDGGDDSQDLSLGSSRSPSEENADENQDSSDGESGGMLDEDSGEEQDSEDEEDDGPSLDLGAAANPDVNVDDLDINKSDVGGAIKPQIDRLIGELRHTFDYFQSQMGGGEVGEIILTGGGSAIKNLPEYLEDQMDREVQRFTPDDHIQGADDGSIQSMLVAFGLWLRTQQGASKLSINLVPSDIVQQRQQKNKKQKVVGVSTLAGLLLVVLIAGGGMMYYWKYQEYQKSQKEIERLKPIVQQIESLKSRQDTLQRRLDVINRLEDQRAQLLPMMRALDQMPKDLEDQTWLKNLSYRNQQSGSSKGVLTVSGITGSFDDVSKVYQWLERMEFVVTVKRESTTQSRTTVTVGETDRSMIQFEADCVVKFTSPSKSKKSSGQNSQT